MSDLERMRRELRVRDAERLAVRMGLAEVRGDVERIGASRAWRFGHALATLAARLLRRRVQTAGAVARALDRIDRLARVLDSAPGPSRTPGPASLCIAIAAASRESAHLGGDFHLASAVARELERRGYRTRLAVLPEEEDAAHTADVVIALRGKVRHIPRVHQLNVLWVISHPGELSNAECDGYDLVCVASEPFAASLRERTATPVMVLDQATDPEVFHPGAEGASGSELVFVGNTRGVRRRIVHDLLPTRRELAVYGSGWNGAIDARHLAAESVPNHELRSIYSSAGIVLSDHWDDMRANGFIANRVYDAVACGALVISDRVEGIEERFGGAVVTYETREELAELVERFLGDRAEREARGSAGRDRVLAAHTVAHRVDTLLTALAERADAVGLSPTIGPIAAARS